jgi:hypothetical protein
MIAVLKALAPTADLHARLHHFNLALECCPPRLKPWVLHRRGSMHSFLKDWKSANRDFAKSMHLLRNDETSSMWPYDPPQMVARGRK